jgi:hypothetical protein
VNELCWLSEYDDELEQTPLEALTRLDDDVEARYLHPERVNSATTEAEKIASAMLSLALTITQTRVSLQLYEDFDDDAFISMQQWNIASVRFGSVQLDWTMLERLSLCTFRATDLCILLSVHSGPLNISRGHDMS